MHACKVATELKQWEFVRKGRGMKGKGVSKERNREGGSDRCGWEMGGLGGVWLRWDITWYRVW